MLLSGDRRSSKPSTTVLLNLELEEAATLDSVRIDMKGLLCLLRRAQFPSDAEIRIDMAFPKGGGLYRDTVHFKCERLRKELFLVLSDMIDTWPNDISKAGSLSLPTVTMNWRGALISASYPATRTAPGFSVKNRHQRLSNHEVMQRGYRMAARLFYRQDEEGFKRDVHNLDTLVGVWTDLVEVYWEDWGMMRPGAYEAYQQRVLEG
jgi:hypothetical protein